MGFGSLQWFFWSGYCTLFAFLVLYLKTKNYDEIQIGFIMSAISIASIVGQPFWGHRSDRRNEIRNILIVCFLISGVASLLIPVFYRSFMIIIIICLIVSFTENSMPTIIDSWTLNAAVERPWIDYGLTRGLGSLGYSLTAVIFGIMLDKFGYQLMFYTHFVFILITAGICLFVDNMIKSKSLSSVFKRNNYTCINNESVLEKSADHEPNVFGGNSNACLDDASIPGKDLIDSDNPTFTTLNKMPSDVILNANLDKQAIAENTDTNANTNNDTDANPNANNGTDTNIKSKTDTDTNTNTNNDHKSSINIKEFGKFIWFLVSTTLVFIGFRATATFFPLLLSQKGGNNRDMGLSLFIMAISEVPVLFLSKRLLGKFKDTAIITVSMFFFILRIFLHIVVPSISGLIAIQATQALSFALFLPASVYYIKRISPEGRGSTYLTVAASCYFGIGGIIGNIAGGFIIDNSSIYTMLWYGTALTVIGMFVFIFSNRQYVPKL